MSTFPVYYNLYKRILVFVCSLQTAHFDAQFTIRLYQILITWRITMKTRKILLVLLIATIVTGLLAGCGSQEKEGKIMDTSEFMAGNEDGNTVMCRIIGVLADDGVLVSVNFADAIVINGNAAFTNDENEQWERIVNSTGEYVRIREAKNGTWEFVDFK